MNDQTVGGRATIGVGNSNVIGSCIGYIDSLGSSSIVPNIIRETSSIQGGMSTRTDRIRSRNYDIWQGVNVDCDAIC